MGLFYPKPYTELRVYFYIFFAMQQYPILGIDLGTCYSCVYAYHKGSIEPVPINGANTIRSAIYVRDGVMLFGSLAMAHAHNEPDNVFYDVKRFIGRTYNEIGDLVQRKNYQFSIMQWGDVPVFVVPSSQDRNSYSVCTPEVLDSYFLRYLVDEAQNYLGYQITDVVITVPAFFQQSQQNTTLAAAQLAGLNVLALFHEPSAAALASNLPPVLELRHVLVYDLGGGTFDLALVETKNALYDVIGSDGDPFLGGSDFDYEMCKIIQDRLVQHGIDINMWNRQKISRLQDLSEKAKIELSTMKSTYIDISLIDSSIECDFDIYRDEFEKAIFPYIQRTLDICHRLLQYTHVVLTPNDAILLVGGSSYIPLVRASLEKAFPNTPILNNVNPAEIVAHGAAWYCLDMYCSKHDPPLQNPLPCPVIHPIVVHSVYVQFGNNPPVLVLPSGVRCQTVERKTYAFSWNGVRVKILTDGDDHQAGNLRELDTFNIRGFFGQAVIEMQMNAKGELEFSYGRQGHRLETRIVGFQHSISMTQLNQFTQRYNLIKKCKNDITAIFTQKQQQGRVTVQARNQYNLIMDWFNNPKVIQRASDDAINRVYRENYYDYFARL